VCQQRRTFTKRSIQVRCEDEVMEVITALLIEPQLPACHVRCPASSSPKLWIQRICWAESQISQTLFVVLRVELSGKDRKTDRTLSKDGAYMVRDFFDPGPEDLNIVLIDASTLHKAERLIESCEHCNVSGAAIPFDHVLDRLTGSDASVTDY